MNIVVYLLLIVSTFFSFLIYNQLRIEKDSRVNNYDFRNKWSILFYTLSFCVPFIWFLDNEGKDKKSLNLAKKIQAANLQSYFNYRSFISMKLSILGLASLLSFLFFIIMKNPIILSFILNVPVQNVSLEIESLILISASFFLMVLIPDIWLKYRIIKYKEFYLEDIPVLQMFIILMLKSKKPLRDILYALTKIDTRYKDVFKITYRKYIRNQNDGLAYLENMFKDTAFRESVLVLKDINEYAIEDSVRLLENNMKQIIEKSNAEKRKKDLTKLVFTQATVVIPFIAIILLGMVPIVYFGFSIFASTGDVFTNIELN